MDFLRYSGSDNELEARKPLSWRLDRFESFSDWTIQISGTKDGDNISTNYYVHRAFLAAGPRSSQYFVRLFRGSGASMQENSSSSSDMVLQGSGLTAFPLYLDFIYTGNLAATTNTATALLHLADYLGCRSLHEETSKFIKKDLKWETSAVYFAEAELYRLDELSKIAFDLCSKNFVRLDGSLLRIPPDLFTRVCTSNLGCFNGVQVSKCIAKYCRGPYAESISGRTLAVLTNAVLIPEVDHTEAIFLLELAIRLRSQEEEGGDNLIDKCISACSRHWTASVLPVILCTDLISATSTVCEVGTISDQPIKRARTEADELSSISPAPLGRTISTSMQLKILTESLLQASREAESAKELLHRERDSFQRERESFKRERSSFNEERTKLQGDVTTLTRIIGRFKRVPVSYQGFPGTALESSFFRTNVYSKGDQTVSSYDTRRKYSSDKPEHFLNRPNDEEGWIYCGEVDAASCFRTFEEKKKRVYGMYYFAAP